MKNNAMESNANYYQSYMNYNYDRVSKNYDENMDYKWQNDNDPRYDFENTVLAACKTKPSNFLALDVGTGTGRISLMIASKFPNANVKGLDQSTQMIEVAKAKAKEFHLNNISFDQYSVETKLPYSEQTFDIVTCSLAMIYFTHKDKFISETNRILKPDGFCCVSTIGNEDMNSVLDPFWELYYKFNPSFVNTFNPRLSKDQSRKLFEDAGYSKVEVTSFKENVIFGSLKDYMALFNTYGLSGLLFFLPKSAAIQLMDEYQKKLESMCEPNGSLIVLREVLVTKGQK